MSPFDKAVNEAMLRLAEDPRVVFIGQSVAYDGAKVHASLDGVAMDKRREMPVAEDFQVGFCAGLALTGVVPVCMFPRFDFALLAANQIVNHLDKMPRFGWRPKVILRVVVGQRVPLDAGPQHTQDHTVAFQSMLTTIPVIRAATSDQVCAAYETALLLEAGSVLIVENPSLDDGDGWDAYS